MNVVIIGLGAIGGVYAVACHDNGIPLRIAVDTARLDRYRANPFIFNDKQYDFDYFVPTESDRVADLVIIATKGDGLGDALGLISPIVGPKTQILPLLNGIISEATTAAMYGFDRVIYGYFIGHTATRQERLITQDGKYVTVFGDKTNNPDALSPRIDVIKQLFDKANIHYRIDRDMVSSMWQKFVINIGLNQITALTRLPYGQVKANPETLALTRALMQEAAAVAKALGIANADIMVERGMDSLDKMMPNDSSSMLQDVVAGRPTEVDMFAGEVCRLGAKHGIPTPENQKLLQLIE